MSLAIRLILDATVQTSKNTHNAIRLKPRRFKCQFYGKLTRLPITGNKPVKVWFADQSRYGLLPNLHRVWRGHSCLLFQSQAWGAKPRLRGLRHLPRQGSCNTAGSIRRTDEHDSRRSGLSAAGRRAGRQLRQSGCLVQLTNGMKFVTPLYFAPFALFVVSTAESRLIPILFPLVTGSLITSNAPAIIRGLSSPCSHFLS